MKTMITRLSILMLLWISMSSVILAQFSGGDGSENDPYIVSTPEQLNAVRNYLSACFILENDIDISGQNWTPIGTNSSSSFQGLFDGNNKKIIGLSISNASAYPGIGLFGYISGTVKNLGIENVNIPISSISGYSVGAVVGYNAGGNVLNCYSTGTRVSSSSTGSGASPRAGGVVGSNTGNVSNCYSTVTVNSSASSISTSCGAGGVVGSNSGNVSNCYFAGSVSTTISMGGGGISYVSATTGGVVGNNSGSVSNCYSTGTVSATANFNSYNTSANARSYAGGVVGNGSNGSVSNCYSTSTVNASSTSNSTSTYSYAYAGGVIGNGSASNCYATGDVRAYTGSGNSYAYAGGIAGSGNASNCVALNSKLTCDSRTWNRFGRVSGDGSSSTNNIAFSEMTVPTGNNGTNYVNGDNINKEAIHESSTLGNKFIIENGWSTENGKLPGLFGNVVIMPIHLRILDNPYITTVSLPNIEVEMEYNQTLGIDSDTPVTWSLENGNLPNGLTLSGNGIISGTPTTAGTFNFTVKAINSSGVDKKELILTVWVPEVIGVRVSPAIACLAKKTTQQFTAKVTTIGNISREVVWTVSGSTSASTAISTDGLLEIGEDETATALTVTAISEGDDTKTSIALITVSVDVIVDCSVMASGEAGAEVRWLLCENGMLVIMGTGAMTNFTSASNVPWYDNRNSIQTLVLSDKITDIGNYAFYECSGITSVTIPENVTSIGQRAFYNCSNLATINFNANSCTTMGNSSNPVFYGCSAFTTLHIGTQVKRIPAYAFSSCNKLTTVTIPESVTIIGDNAFYNCTSLETVNYNAINCTSMGSSNYPVFSGCASLTTLNIDNNITRIPAYAFSSCNKLTTITIPSSVTIIGDNAFYNCTQLNNVTVPWNTPLAVPQYVFSGVNCVNVTLNVPVGTAYLYRKANVWKEFKISLEMSELPCSSPRNYGIISGCQMIWSICDSTLNISGSGIMPISPFWNSAYTNYIKYVTINDDVTNVASSVFNNCINLSSFDVAANNSAYSSLDGVLFDKNKTTLLKYPRGKQGAYSIPNTVASIGDNAFEYCNLTSVTIPNSVKTISISAFSNCSDLTELTIPDSVTSIGNSAFYNCTGLKSVSIGNSVTSIGNNAFYNCIGLKSVIIPQNITSIGDYAFRSCSSLMSVDFNATSCSAMGTTSSPVFNSCSKLTQVNIGANVKTISAYAFKNCATLTSIVIPDNVTSIGTDAFAGCPLTDVTMPFVHTPLLTTQLEKLTITSACTSLNSSCFSSVKNNLQELTLPFIGTSANATGENAVLGVLFGTSTSATAVTQYYSETQSKAYAIPSTLKKVTIGYSNNNVVVGYGALYGCSFLKEVTFSSNITGVSEKALFGCSSLDDIYAYRALPPSAYANSTFDGVNKFSCKLHVPANSKQYYSHTQAVGWNEFAFIEEEAPFLITVKALPLNGGQITGLTEHNYGETASLTANEHSGYEFKYWLEGGSVVSYDREYSFTVTADCIVYAVFAARENGDDNITVTPSVSSAMVEWMEVADAESYILVIYTDESRTQEFAHFDLDKNGNIVTRSVKRNVSCTFDGLSEETTYYYTLNSYDSEGYALSISNGNFSTTASNSLESLYENNNIALYPNPATDGFCIKGLEQATEVILTDLSGKVHLKQTVSVEEYIQTNHLSKGMYIVHVGNYAAKLIVK
ncbi:hypothetical protein M2138_002111 [Dysgonomonadaceae bacterium PH5-43]|nr:hypothetical protein [Dysgonomonadaceae bacterium PH5-43]